MLAIPGAAELDRLHAEQRLPYDIAPALTIAQVVEVARALPAVRGSRLMPAGYGLFPPVGAEPMIRLKHDTIDPYRRPIPAGAYGMVGCLWNTSRGPVLRLWFRAAEAAKDSPRPEVRGPVDAYEDMIAGAATLEGKLPHLTGWQICRLDANAEGA